MLAEQFIVNHLGVYRAVEVKFDLVILSVRDRVSESVDSDERKQLVLLFAYVLVVVLKVGKAIQFWSLGFALFLQGLRNCCRRWCREIECCRRRHRDKSAWKIVWQGGLNKAANWSASVVVVGELGQAFCLRRVVDRSEVSRAPLQRKLFKTRA